MIDLQEGVLEAFVEAGVFRKEYVSDYADLVITTEFDTNWVKRDRQRDAANTWMRENGHVWGKSTGGRGGGRPAWERPAPAPPVAPPASVRMVPCTFVGCGGQAELREGMKRQTLGTCTRGCGQLGRAA